jgi:ADP-ribose pyrophosphatase YjhB (NUDIX family)
MEKKVTCRGINGESTEVGVSKLSFRPSVYGVIVKDGKVLLSSQWDGWDFPGGGMELGESIAETFSREILEETGLQVKQGQLLHVSDSFFTHPNQRHYHTIVMYFTGEDVRGEISTEGFDEHEKIYAREAQWIPLSDVSTLKFYNQVDSLGLIRRAAEGRGL